MLIEQNMDLGALAERMGNGATREDAAIMCEFLLAGVNSWDKTEDVPESVWNDCLEMAVKAQKFLMNLNTGTVQTAADWAADGYTTGNADLVEVAKDSTGSWVEA